MIRHLLLTGFLSILALGASANPTHSGLASYHGYRSGTYVTAARNVPRGSTLLVWDPEHPSHKIKVRVVDSGPYVRGRILDLSRNAYINLYGSLRSGVAPVRYRVIHRVQHR